MPNNFRCTDQRSGCCVLCSIHIQLSPTLDGFSNDAKIELGPRGLLEGAKPQEFAALRQCTNDATACSRCSAEQVRRFLEAATFRPQIIVQIWFFIYPACVSYVCSRIIILVKQIIDSLVSVLH